jgi:hypothetical protein
MTSRSVALAIFASIPFVPAVAHAEFDPCWDSSGGCWSMPSPPEMSDPSPSSSNDRVEHDHTPYVPAPNHFIDNLQSGVEKERALDNERRVSAWRKSREKEVDGEIGRLIDARKDEIARLQKSVKIWQRVAKGLPAGKDVQDELKEWAEQSEEAQAEAIRASVTLAAGAWGERFEEAHEHYQMAENTFFKLDKELLDVQAEAEALAAKCVDDPKLAKALGDVSQALKDARSTLAEGNIVQLHALWSKEFYEKCSHVLGLLHYGEAIPADRKELETEQQVRLLLEKIQAVSIDNLGDLTVDALLDHAKDWKDVGPRLTDPGSKMDEFLEKWTVYLRCGRFVGEYGLAVARFGIAWSNIEDLRSSIDDSNAKIALAGQRIKDDTDALVARKKELDWLQKAKTYSLERKEDVLGAFNDYGRDRAKELDKTLLGISIVVDDGGAIP